MRYLCSALTAAVALPLLFQAGVRAQEAPADLVVRNGKIVTLDERTPIAEALATRGDRILVVGRDDEVRKLIGPQTKVLDLAGRLAIPGFLEGHGHLTGLGQSKMVLDLRRAQTWDDIIRQVEEAARKAPAGEWILGRGWHQEKWTAKPDPQVDGYPVHTRLSQVTPKNPVLLTHASGHMSFANAEAMRLAGVDASTRNPAGGELLRDAQGNPTGVFRETAQGLIRRAEAQQARLRSPEERARDLDTAIRLAQAECLAKGVTSFQDAGSAFDTIDVFKRLAECGSLQIRLWVMVRAGNEELARRLPSYRMIGVGDNHLTVRAIKHSIDGALGPHGAWLLEPYEDLRSSTGLNTTSIAAIRETARLAIQHDYQLCVHAIGDRANRETLNIFEEAFRESPRAQPRRWRVEHAQHLHTDDIPRFAKLGVIASMQGNHCTSDAVFVLQRLGLRRASEGAYVWQSLIKSGAIVSNGTDTPVEDVDPIACFHASVTRKLANGTTFFPEQKMTREQALRSYTIQAAYAAFEEDIKGTLSPGKLADVVVLSQDLLTVPDEKLLDTKVVYTIVGGKIRYAGE
jgi:predicted amidohydrolase YtcJ